MRAAFAAATRGGWRAGGAGDGLIGTLVPGAPASYAVWDVGELDVEPARQADAVRRWSTDPRSRVPALPRLGPTDRCPAVGKPCIGVSSSMARGIRRFDRWMRPGEDTDVIPAVRDDDTGVIPAQDDDARRSDDADLDDRPRVDADTDEPIMSRNDRR